MRRVIVASHDGEREALMRRKYGRYGSVRKAL